MNADRRHRAKPSRYVNRMTIPELAEVMECSEQSAYRIAESGRFGSFKEGNVYFVSRRAVMNWIEGKPEPAPEVTLLRRYEHVS